MLLQSEEDPMMAQVQLVAQKKLTILREREKELQQQVSELSSCSLQCQCTYMYMYVASFVGYS